MSSLGLIYSCSVNNSGHNGGIRGPQVLCSSSASHTVWGLMGPQHLYQAHFSPHQGQHWLPFSSANISHLYYLYLGLLSPYTPTNPFILDQLFLQKPWIIFILLKISGYHLCYLLLFVKFFWLFPMIYFCRYKDYRFSLSQFRPILLQGYGPLLAITRSTFCDLSAWWHCRHG